jgi:hypothetical protein
MSRQCCTCEKSCERKSHQRQWEGQGLSNEVIEAQPLLEAMEFALRRLEASSAQCARRLQQPTFCPALCLDHAPTLSYTLACWTPQLHGATHVG